MYRSRFFTFCTAVAISHVIVLLATAADNFWQPTGTANWNVDSNWSGFNVPDATTFQDVAIITNGGTAQVTGTPPNAGDIVLGQDPGEMGTLEITGNLTAETDGGVGVVFGRVLVGRRIDPNNVNNILVGGSGILNISGNGSLTAEFIQSGGDQGGTFINLSGNAQLISNGAMDLRAITDITGQSVNLSAATNLTIPNQPNTLLRIDINGAAAPLLKAGGTASLGGTLEIDFGGGSPTPGDTWNLVDAGDISGSFSQINPVNATIGEFQQFRVREVASGSSMNGNFGQLVLDQLLVLEVDRESGAMKIVNPSTSTPVSIDGYAVTTSHNSFNTSNGVWTSLADQSVPGWIEANPKPTQLAELDSNVASPLGGGSEHSLGSPWQPQFTQLGQNREDLSFQYTTEDGDIFSGPIVYTGTTVNDIALFVDDVGNAQLRNASGFTADIEGYSIVSPSGQLMESGWTSLQDNSSLSDWLEANPQPTALSELKTAGVETLSPSEAYNLGQIFAGGMQDLVFAYLLAGESVPDIGRVLYQDLPSISPGLTGDYNNDGKVDAADYVVWRKTGINGQQGYDDWRANFGAMAPGAGAGANFATTAVPEPTSLVLAVAFAAFGVYRCGSRHTSRNVQQVT